MIAPDPRDAGRDDGCAPGATVELKLELLDHSSLSGTTPGLVLYCEYSSDSYRDPRASVLYSKTLGKTC